MSFQSNDPQSLSDFLNDGDTTEEDLELFSDKFIGKIDYDESSLNSALESLKLDDGADWLSFSGSGSSNGLEDTPRPIILPPPSSELYGFRDSLSEGGNLPAHQQVHQQVPPEVHPNVQPQVQPQLHPQQSYKESTPPPQDIINQPVVTPPSKIISTEQFNSKPIIDNPILPTPTPIPTSTSDDLTDFYQTFSKLNIDSKEIIPHPNKTLILLSPLSYKHVFSRNWVKKSYLDSIVERPQRLMAASLGIGSAVAKSPSKFHVEISTAKKDLRESKPISKVHGSKWANRLYQLCNESSEKLKNSELEVPSDWHEGDIYLTGETIDALEGVLAVSELAVDKIYNENESKVFVSIRPPGHHSHPCVPSGFCLINNVHIAIQYAREKYDITHAVILDFDLHHGDGSQDICWKLAGFEEEDEEEEEEETRDITNSTVKSEGNDTTESPVLPPPIESSPTKRKGKKVEPPPPPPPLSIGYFSIHDINSFPTELGYATAENIKNASICLMAHQMSIWNIHLEPYKDENHFNEIYDKKYSILFDKAKQYLQTAKTTTTNQKQPFKPFIILSAGFDSSEYEYLSMQRHNVSVPTSFFNRFTNDSVKLANEFADGKLVSMLEGGYSDGALSTGIFSHLTGLAEEEWDSNWCNANVVKHLTKGCKPKWNPTTVEPSWVNPGIELGRSLWPQEVKDKITALRNPPTRKNHNKFANEDLALATPLRVLRDSTRKAAVIRGS